MRHRKVGRKLGRSTKHRQALFSNMVQALIREERIVTTLAKAKEMRSVADRMVTLAKRGDLNARRLAAKRVKTPELLQKLFDVFPQRFANREGGYTRVVRLGRRRGDGAEMAILEYLAADGIATETASETAAEE